MFENKVGGASQGPPQGCHGEEFDFQTKSSETALKSSKQGRRRQDGQVCILEQSLGPLCSEHFRERPEGWPRGNEEAVTIFQVRDVGVWTSVVMTEAGQRECIPHLLRR